MEYITHRRFKKVSISGEVNIPAQQKCTAHQGTIFYNNQAICYTTSENAHQYFALNTDGKGLERGRLTQLIQKTLAKKDKQHQQRWDKIWEDKRCQTYRNKGFEDFWLWGHAFFTAPIQDLQHIANLIGVK